MIIKKRVFGKEGTEYKVEVVIKDNQIDLLLYLVGEHKNHLVKTDWYAFIPNTEQLISRIKRCVQSYESRDLTETNLDDWNGNIYE